MTTSSLFGDYELRLPRKLVRMATAQMERHGMIFSDTAALLIEAGADMHRLDEQVMEQSINAEAA